MGHGVSGLSSCLSKLAFTGFVSGDLWVPMYLSLILLASGILSSILSRNKNPVQPTQSENKPYFLLWQNQNLYAARGEDLRQVSGPQPEPGVGSAWPCLGIRLGPSRREHREQ